MASLYPSVKDGMEDEAEKHLVRVLEERRAQANSKNNYVRWDASVEGETPPLRRLSEEGINVFDPTKGAAGGEHGPPKKNRLTLLARKVCNMKSQGKLSDNRNLPLLEKTELSPTNRALNPIEEATASGKPSDIFYRIHEDTDAGLSEFARAHRRTDSLFSAVLAVDMHQEKDDTCSSSTGAESEGVEVMDDEMLPLTDAEESRSGRSTGGWFGYGSTDDGESRRRKIAAQQKERRKRRKKLRKSLRAIALSVKSFIRLVATSWFTRLGLPSLVVAFILFYYMGNPMFDFMDKGTVSWWLVFACRQTITLELALLSQFLIIDCFALSSRWVHKVIGPLITLVIINAEGWPFIAFSWSIWDLFILQGDEAFPQNWLFFTGMPIFSPLNPGGRILHSKPYLHILTAVVVAAAATAIKRTAVALYLGKKSFAYYKPRLGKLLSDIALVAEVAELASEAEAIAAMSLAGNTSVTEAVTEKKREGALGDAKLRSLKNFKTGSNKADLLSENSDVVGDDGGIDGDGDVTSDDSHVDDDGMSTDDGQGESDSSDHVGSSDGAEHHKSVSSTGSYRRMKNLLDRWEEPGSKADPNSDTSISDILKFRKALSYMDGKYPFSLSFGLVTSRDECIKSSQRTYRRLMHLENPSADSLSFDIIGLLAFDADGVENERKLMALKTMFRPGRFNEITLVAFVQACDSLYKRLRYFRASVGNSSVIDHVLEQMIDAAFYFVLALVILFLLEFNPWPLLVSASTLLVSFAFAIGPSFSRYIEGMLMIVIRHPYDLGDRVLITGPEVLEENGVRYSWFVEDITVFSTTLRFGSTGEVSTVDNGSIAKSRIVNYNRSPNAIVSLRFCFNMATDDKLVLFREAVEAFVKDRPRIWDQILFFRVESIDTGSLLKEFTLRLRHVKAWQEASTILMNKSELYAYCIEVAERLALNYDLPPRSFNVTNSFAPAQVEGDGAIVKEDSPIAGDSAASQSLLMMLKGRERKAEST